LLKMIIAMAAAGKANRLGRFNVFKKPMMPTASTGTILRAPKTYYDHTDCDRDKTISGASGD